MNSYRQERRLDLEKLWAYYQVVLTLQQKLMLICANLSLLIISLVYIDPFNFIRVFGWHNYFEKVFKIERIDINFAAPYAWN